MQSSVQIGGFGTVYLLEGDATNGAYALLEHSLEPGVLGAPPHRHTREDEVSYVLEGTLTVMREETISEIGPGGLARKPRGEWHTFWNGSRQRVRFLEIVSPPAFVGYFRELAALIRLQSEPDPTELGALASRYGLELDFASVGPLLELHGLRLG
jgi:mannose-6-phosphate isomerase-like protein (cupin superfamily)